MIIRPFGFGSACLSTRIPCSASGSFFDMHCSFGFSPKSSEMTRDGESLFVMRSFCRGSFFAAADAGDLLMEVPPETATGDTDPYTDPIDDLS